MLLNNFFSKQGPKYGPQTNLVSSRISQIAGYGYQFSPAEKKRLDSRIKLFRANGGLPDWYLHPSLSVNRNIFNTTTTLSTQTVTLLVGIYTFNFQSGAGSITSSNGTGTASNHGAVTAGVSRTITVSVAGTFTFTVSGIVNNAQLEVGSIATTYIARIDNTAVKVLNLGAKNALGDCTYVNGTSRNMQGYDGTSGRTIKTVSASSQSLLSGITDYYTDFTFMQWYKPTNLVDGRAFRKGTDNDRLSYLSTGTLQFNATTGSVNSLPGLIVAGVWQLLGFSVSNVTGTIFKNGVQQTPIVNTLSARTPGIQPYSISGPDTFLNGDIGETIMIPANLSAAQHLAIYNATKSTYGL
jgi:hypothetical protein